jgi:hypothetical protein
MPELAVILLVATIFGLALLPTRRLFVSGWSTRPLAAYFAALFGLGLLLALTRGRIGFLLPVLVLAYIAPFITARQGISAVRGRLAPGTKNVTPPDEYSRSKPRDPGAGASGGD